MNLNPMTLGEILDHSFTLLKAQLKSYLCIALVPVGISICLNIFFVVGMFNGKADPMFMSDGYWLAMVPLFLVWLAAFGGLVKKSSEQIFDREIGVMGAYQFGLRKVWPLIIGSILCIIVYLIGGVFLIIPGIYLLFRCILFTHTIVIEDCGPVSALRRSMELTKGFWWRTFAVFFFVPLLSAVLAYVVAIPFSLIGHLLLSGMTAMVLFYLIMSVVNLAIVPYELIAFTLYYYDLRIRKENLDMQQMVDNLTGQASGNLPS